MKILLLGEYSNLHWTLAQGLRHIGHDVCVASGGDKFKNYNRHISLARKGYNPKDSVKYIFQLVKHFSNFRGYDVVQLINPCFLDLKADKNLLAFRYLKKYNGKVFMGAFGDDAYWLQTCLEKKAFRYSEFDIPNRSIYMESAQQLIRTWSDKDKIRINKEIAEKCDGVIACLYEYFVSYQKNFSDKLTYIPQPINISEITFTQRGLNDRFVSFFIGIHRQRSQIKGTDIMYEVLKEVQKNYSDECKVVKTESIPYHQYLKMMNECDVLLDQLYSYSPAMNALTAMAQGIAVVGGGEPEIYELLGEQSIKPIINVIPTEQDIYNKLSLLIQNKSDIAGLSAESRLFVEKHHDYVSVAYQYLDFWNKSKA